MASQTDEEIRRAIVSLKAISLATKAVTTCTLSNAQFSFSVVVSMMGSWMDSDDPDFEAIVLEASAHAEDMLKGARMLAGLPPENERN